MDEQNTWMQNCVPSGADAMHQCENCDRDFLEEESDADSPKCYCSSECEVDHDERVAAQARAVLESGDHDHSMNG